MFAFENVVVGPADSDATGSNQRHLRLARRNGSFLQQEAAGLLANKGFHELCIAPLRDRVSHGVGGGRPEASPRSSPLLELTHIFLGDKTSAGVHQLFHGLALDCLDQGIKTKR